MTISEFSVLLSDLVANWDRYMDEFFKSIEPDLIDANTEQLDSGLDATGATLPPYQNPEYAAMKGRTIPDLKLTGDFWSGFVASQLKDSIIIDSTDSKRDKLVAKYGADIFGLTDQRLDRLIKDQILPDFQLFLRNKLQLR